MTTGSYSFGYLEDNPVIGSKKSWSGVDGKTESWSGGIRLKWNNYTMTHGRFSRTKWRTQSPPYVYDVGKIADRDFLGPSGIRAITGWTANDDLRVLEKLAEEVRGHSFDLGVNLAEAGKTYGTVVNNLRSIGNALHDLKRGRVTDAFRNLGQGRQRAPLTGRDVSGRWLEMQYAWRPLVSQSYEAAKALEAVTGPRVLRFKASVATKRTTVNESSSPTVYKKNVRWTYNRYILAELSEDISTSRSLGLTNPAEVAWELVPYSFVVDWFIPVGTYIGAWGVIPALRGRFLTIERGGAKHGPSDISVGTTPNSTWQFYAAGNHREQLFKYSRTVSSSLSIPIPTFNSVPKALSPAHLLNAVALIHQRLK